VTAFQHTSSGLTDVGARTILTPAATPALVAALTRRQLRTLLEILRKLRGNCLTLVRLGPPRRVGELCSAWVCGGRHNHWIMHAHSNAPSKQQIDQTTNQTKKKKINQASTPSTQKSMTEPFTPQANNPSDTHIR
jgi:hypothetical protein